MKQGMFEVDLRSAKTTRAKNNLDHLKSSRDEVGLKWNIPRTTQDQHLECQVYLKKHMHIIA